MKIASFTVHAPDQDGYINSSLTLEVENQADGVVRMIRSMPVCYSGDGSVISTTRTGEDFVNLQAGEVMLLTANSPDLRSEWITGNHRDVTVRVFLHTYRREYFKIGEIPVPSGHNAVTTLHVDVQSETIEPRIHVAVIRSIPDDDGTIRLEWRSAVINATGRHLPKVVLKVDLVDDEDSLIESGETETEASPHSCGFLEGSFWVKKSQTRDARLRFSVAVYVPLAFRACEARATEMSDQD